MPGRWLVAILILPGACMVDASTAGVPYGCAEDGLCPAGLECVAGQCVAAGANGSDARPIDAAPPDGLLPGPDPDAGAGVPDAPAPDALDPTLLLWHRFETAPAEGILDSSGHGRHGTCLTGGCPALVEGRLGNGYQFDGVDDFVSIPTADALHLQTFTVTAWFKPAALQRSSIFTQVHGTSANSWQLELDAQGEVSFTTRDTDHVYLWTPAAAYAAGGWTHVAGTWDGATKRLYVNGTERASLAMGTMPFDGRPLLIGADDNAGRTLELEGVIDDVRFYGRVLSPGEIAALANP